MKFLREGGILDKDGKLTYFYSAQINFTRVRIPGIIIIIYANKFKATLEILEREREVY